jgi:cobalt-zinc-cadmium efflux system outer membrane protein
MTVDDLVQAALLRNPRLARATLAIDAARGRQIQAGLYPNPVLAVIGDELGDRQGPAGIITAPQVTQEIVTAGKLKLSQAVAAREVDQASLNVLAERYAVIGSVRAAFYEVYALEQRREILSELVKLSEQAVGQAKIAVENKQMARIDLVPLEVELERFRADAESLDRELPPARGRLAALTGDPRKNVARLAGSFDLPPAYDFERAREVVMTSHPDVRSARVGVERAQAALRRAEVEPIPNLSVSTGYVRQSQNKSNDWMLGVSAPVPLWNRNQGNIREAQANFGIAIQDVTRAENDVAERLSVTFRTYASARQRAERYRTQIVPRAEESYGLAMKAFKGGQFEYLRVIQAQRAAAEARLELNRSLGEAWRAAGELSGLLLEEVWPGTEPGPGAGPVMQPPRELP